MEGGWGRLTASWLGEWEMGGGKWGGGEEGGEDGGLRIGGDLHPHKI